MKIIESRFISVKGFVAFNFFGVMLVRKGTHVSFKTIIHEKIHTEQMKELLFIPFYILYVLEWLIRLPFYGRKAYNNISFEREAYKHQDDLVYLNYRKRYAFLKYIFKK